MTSAHVPRDKGAGQGSLVRAWRRALVAVAAATVVVVSAACTEVGLAEPGAEDLHRPSGVEGPFPVVRVVDGDTISVRASGGLDAVRLIGVDTPETKRPHTGVQCFGPQAARYSSGLMSGASVWLESDQVAGDRDRYGRRLAYVWLDSDRLINLLLISGGYGREYTFGHQMYKYRTEFEQAQRAASRSGRGLWSAC